MFFRRLLTLCFWLAATIAGGTWLLWALGQIFNDSWHLTQYFYWLPTPIILAGMVAAGTILLLLLFAIRALDRRHRSSDGDPGVNESVGRKHDTSSDQAKNETLSPALDAPPQPLVNLPRAGRLSSRRRLMTPARPMRQAVLAIWVCALLCLGWSCYEQRLYRYITSSGTKNAALVARSGQETRQASELKSQIVSAAEPASSLETRAQSLRVLAWNPATDYIDDFAERVATVPADVLAITNRPGHTKWDALRDHVGGARSMARFGRLTIISHFRVVSWGGCTLGIEGARKQTTVWRGGGEVSQDSGEGFFVELDTTARLGRTTTIWIVDIPSDIGLHRDRVFSQASQALREFRGPVFGRSDANLDIAKPIAPSSAGAGANIGFPSADLIVGDFNTPRGSRSMRRVVGDLDHAYDQVGRGWAATWRRDVPLIAIDQAFVGSWLRTVTYSIRDMGAGSHRAQVIEVERRQR